MVKTLVEHIADAYLEYYPKVTESGKEIIRYKDNMIVWPVSLSTGAIVLLLSSMDKQTFIPSQTVKIAVILFVICVICGLLARLINAHLMEKSSTASDEFYFRTLLEKIPHNPLKLSGKETAAHIYIMLQECFKIDIPSVLQESDEDARKYYDEYVEFSTAELDRASKLFDNLMVDTFGYNDDYFEKKRQINRIKGKQIRRQQRRYLNALEHLSSLFYFGAVLLFIASILYLVINIDIA